MRQREKKKKKKTNTVSFKVADSGWVAHIRPSVRLVCKHLAPSKVFFCGFVFLGRMEKKKTLQVPPGLEKKNAAWGQTEIPQPRRHNKDEGSQPRFARITLHNTSRVTDCRLPTAAICQESTLTVASVGKLHRLHKPEMTGFVLYRTTSSSLSCPS